MQLVGRRVTTLLAISYFTPTKAQVAHIDKGSWSDLFSGEKVCGDASDAKHPEYASSCMRPLGSSETDAPSTPERRLYLAYDESCDKGGATFSFSNVLSIPKSARSSTQIRQDQLAAMLIGHADAPGAGAIFLIDSTTARNVECGGKA